MRKETQYTGKLINYPAKGIWDYSSFVLDLSCSCSSLFYSPYCESMLSRRVAPTLLRFRGSIYQEIWIRRFTVGNDNGITKQAIEDLVKEKKLYYVKMPEVLDDKVCSYHSITQHCSNWFLKCHSM